MLGAPLVAPILAVPLTAALAWLGLAVAGRELRETDPAAHWAERARRVFVSRRVLAFAGVFAAAVSLPLAVGGPVSVGHRLGLPLAALLSVGTALALFFRFEDRAVRRIPAAARLRSFLALVLAVAPGYALLLAVPLVAPSAFATAPAFLAYAAAVVLATLGGGVLVERPLGWVRPAPERLRAALTRLPGGDPPPRLWTIRVLHANAFALHWLGAVVFTEGALDRLDDGQLGAVLAHELEHLREPRAARVSTLLTALLLPLGVPLLWLLGRGRSELLRLLVADAGLVLFVLVLRAHRRVRRAMEQRSDAAAAQAASAAYASALEAIGEANLSPAVLGTRRVHPDLVDRLAAAGVTPTWPRPAPPPSIRLPVLVMALAAAVVLGATLEARRWLSASRLDEASDLWAVAVGGSADALGTLGWLRAAQGRAAEGLPLLRAARELDPHRLPWPAWEAWALAGEGRCQEAREALAAANALAEAEEGEDGLASTGEAVRTCEPR